jgi:hypothetical protein
MYHFKHAHPRRVLLEACPRSATIYRVITYVMDAWRYREEAVLNLHRGSISCQPRLSETIWHIPRRLPQLKTQMEPRSLNLALRSLMETLRSSSFHRLGSRHRKYINRADLSGSEPT